MSSLEDYVMHVKPAMNTFLQDPNQQTLAKLQDQIQKFNWVQLKIYHGQILVPLVLKLEELSGESQDLRTNIINCLRYLLSKMYLDQVKGLQSILMVVLQQIREINANNSAMKPDLSEEIKLAAVQCITEALRRSTGEVLEQFYKTDSVLLLGQLLLTLIELINMEKYKLLLTATLKCLMTVFYVHDEADASDVVLRNQVADTIFIFLPKVIIILLKTSLASDIVGETIKALSIKALGRIIGIMFEETTNDSMKVRYDADAFQRLFSAATESEKLETEDLIDSHINFSKKGNCSEIEQRLKDVQLELRSQQWINSTSCKIRPVFTETATLRSHDNIKIRKAYAEMFCLLLTKCAQNLKFNFMYILENVLAMCVDEERSIAEQCCKAVLEFQQRQSCQDIFEEYAELLFDAHLSKLPRILHRCDDTEQYAELLFLKAFLKNINQNKLALLLGVQKNLELFIACLLTALKLRLSRDLLDEEYMLRQICTTTAFKSWPWRQFKHLRTSRSVQVLYDICEMLGETPLISHLIFDYCLDQLDQQNPVMNEIILLLTLLSTTTPTSLEDKQKRIGLVELLMEELMKDKHWHLALQPDQVYRLKVDKPSSWVVERTPGLYESAVEIRMQDYDSDDEHDEDAADIQSRRVTILDAQFNVLHTCIVLDAVGNCAQFIGENFDRYIFRSLHTVLLKLANSNTYIYQAANYAFVCMQSALKFSEVSHFIESSTDYITYHLNALLKRTPQSSSAVDILSVVLQYSTRTNLSHLYSIFETIKEECSKPLQRENLESYLRVINAFLQHVNKWLLESNAALDALIPSMSVDNEIRTEQEIVDNWLNAFNEPCLFTDEVPVEEEHHKDESLYQPDQIENEDILDNESCLPQHIEMSKTLLTLVVKFISTASQMQQILALECLISGVPLLKDYSNELLPLVHLIWQPLVEKFRQKDSLVLNRCFTLLHIIGIHAKEFILKRSLNDVVPFLSQFLREAATRSAVEHPKVQTQEYKLQRKLLNDFANLIINLQIDGKHLYDISETIALYLADTHPSELQELAVIYFKTLMEYNGPFIYLIIQKHVNLGDYKHNVTKILSIVSMNLN